MKCLHCQSDLIKGDQHPLDKKLYGDDYEVVIAGENETLAADLNAVHMDNSSVPNNFFQIC